MQTVVLTSLALIAFAGNSVLCRLALAEQTIDAGSFTWIRLLSGVLVLALILALSRNAGRATSKGSWTGGLSLFVYAVAFSYAYISLDTGTGALILFGSVQITMIIAGLWAGERLNSMQCLGVLLAFAGLVYLIFPSVSTPSLFGFVLMAAAGIAWGVYSMMGKRSTAPLSDTAYNFYRTIPFVIVLAILSFEGSHVTRKGVVLAILSGGLTSGVGYAIWYRALEGLSSVQAAVWQLLVPIIAAFGGVLFTSELLSLNLVVSAALVLGGILIVILTKHGRERASSKTH